MLLLQIKKNAAEKKRKRISASSKMITNKEWNEKETNKNDKPNSIEGTKKVTPDSPYLGNEMDFRKTVKLIFNQFEEDFI